MEGRADHGSQREKVKVFCVSGRGRKVGFGKKERKTLRLEGILYETNNAETESALTSWNGKREIVRGEI